MSEGIKFDEGKLPYELIPHDAEELIAGVLRHGAKKYGARNWEKGMDWSRLYGGVRRHMQSWFQREDLDPETGLSHLAHAACGILFLIALQNRDVGKDDREQTKLEKP